MICAKQIAPHYEDNSYDIQHISILDIPFNMYHFNSSINHHVRQINLHTDVAEIFCHLIDQ